MSAIPSPFTVLWLQAGSCGGCTMSALGAEAAGLVETLGRAGIRFLWHPSLSEETGRPVLDLLERVADGSERLDALCVEGAVLRGPGGTGRFQLLAGSGRPVADWVTDLAARARYVLAMGSCAAFGGIPAADGSVTEPQGLQYESDVKGGLLGEGFASGAGLPVINVAGCAPHPGWVVETLMALALGELTAQGLDQLGRPRFYADHLAHHGCIRNEYYEYKAGAQKPGQQGCLMENLGCKATQAPGDCNRRVWNGGGSCTNAGYACINCTSPGFEGPGSPYLETSKVAGIPVGLPVDMPKAWFVALGALSKSATPERVKTNATADRVVVPPVRRRPGIS